jgi:hypothetical protein
MSMRPRRLFDWGRMPWFFRALVVGDTSAGIMGSECDSKILAIFATVLYAEELNNSLFTMLGGVVGFDATPNWMRDIDR